MGWVPGLDHRGVDPLSRSSRPSDDAKGASMRQLLAERGNGRRRTRDVGAAGGRRADIVERVGQGPLPHVKPARGDSNIKLSPNSQGDRNGSEMRGAVVWRITSRFVWTVWGTDKRAETSTADAHVTSQVGWPRPRAGPAWRVGGGVMVGLWGAPGGKIPRARLYPNHLLRMGTSPRWYR
jgi:hypothetical protein